MDVRLLGGLVLATGGAAAALRRCVVGARHATSACKGKRKASWSADAYLPARLLCVLLRTRRPQERHLALRPSPPPPRPPPPLPAPVPAAPEPSRNDAAEAEAVAAAALQAAEEAKASAEELARQLAVNEAARQEAERQRDEAEAKLAVMAHAAAEAAAAEEAAAEEAAAEAVVKALRLAEATAAAAAATDASRAAGQEPGEQGKAEAPAAAAGVTDPFAELPALPPRPEATPGSLVMRAIQSGAQAGEEWAAQFAAMLRQAEQDASAFQGELQHREEQFGARLGAIRDEAMARIAAARQAARQATVHAERLRQAVDASQVAYLAASQRLDDAIRVRAQRSAARVAAETALTEASALVTDRLLHLEALDAQRQRLNVLSAAFAARDRARDEESSAHALAVALMAFEAALQDGQPLTDHVERILGACHAPHAHTPLF